MSPSGASDVEPREYGVVFWTAAVVGAAIVAFGIVGLLHDRALTKPSNLGLWLVGAGIVHDAVIAPVVVAAAAATSRVPVAARVPVRLALVASGLLVLITWPLVHAYGVRSANPSLLPRNYGVEVLTALCVVWLVAAGAVAVRIVRQR